VAELSDGHSKWVTRLNAAANIAIIVVACMLVVVLGRTYLFNPAKSTRGGVAVGDRVNLGGLPATQEQQILVVALSTQCHFCTESSPFYRKLVDSIDQSKVHLTAAFPQPREEAETYLRDLRIAIQDIRPGSLRALNVAATPTLLLVDSQGIVIKVWRGKLSSDGELEVLSALK
jgi:hypothetical protein